MNPNPSQNSQVPKKKWQKPELIFIAPGNVNGGANPAHHEANFTANRTHYHYPGGPTVVVSTGQFNAYVS